MDREATIAALLQGETEEVRRLGLDQMDDAARRAGTWGSTEHRRGRDKIENTYDAVRRSLETLSDAELQARWMMQSNKR